MIDICIYFYLQLQFLRINIAHILNFIIKMGEIEMLSNTT